MRVPPSPRPNSYMAQILIIMMIIHVMNSLDNFVDSAITMVSFVKCAYLEKFEQNNEIIRTHSMRGLTHVFLLA